MKRTKSIYLALLVMLSPVVAFAGPIVDGGQITGFSGLDIGGTLYDAEFVEGTCASVWDECDEASDFFWQTEAEAEAAMEALLAGVATISTETSTTPGAMYGCDTIAGCYMYTALFVDGEGPANYWASFSYAPGVGTVFDAGSSNDLITADSSDYDHAVNVRWSLTPVPEPGTLALLGLGLAGMAARRRKV